MNNNNQTFQGNGGSNDVFTPSTRSSYKFFNSTSSLDKTMLTFTYWNSLLRITMNPIIVQDGSANKVDTNNRIDMYFSPSKAQMFFYTVFRHLERIQMLIRTLALIQIRVLSLLQMAKRCMV